MIIRPRLPRARSHDPLLGIRVTAVALALVIQAPTAAAPITGPLALPSEASSATGAGGPKIKEGLAALKADRLKDAEAAFKAALAADPGAGSAHLGLAEVAGRQGDAAGVERHLKAGRKAAPQDIGLLQSLVNWHVQRGRMDPAEAALREAVEAQPRSAALLTMLGEFYLARAATVPRAEELFKRALEAEPSHTSSQVGLARALVARGQAAEARALLEAAAKAQPRAPQPLHALARLAVMQGRIDEAISLHRRTIEVAPAFAAAYMDQGELHLARGDAEAALRIFRAGIQEVSDPTPLIFRAALANQAAQRWDDAEKSYLEALRRDPSLFGAYNNLAVMAAERKLKLDRALEWAKQAKKLAPQNPSVQDTLGWVHRARGELPQAAAALQEAARMAPDDATIAYHLGVVFAEQGRQGDARRELQRALKTNPTHRYSADARARLERLEPAKVPQ